MLWPRAAVPGVRMNPLLLKPEAIAQPVVLLEPGERNHHALFPGATQRAWWWPVQIAAALDDLRAENDVVVIEGAGSPAETNLARQRHREHARCAPCWCGVACSSPTSTVAAPLPTYGGTGAAARGRERALIHGFVLNKFRATPACSRPRRSTYRSAPACPPWPPSPCRHHGPPEEDGV